MLVSFKFKIEKRLKDRLESLKQETGLSISKLINAFIADGLYKMYEEEKEYGEIKLSEIDSKRHS